MELYGEVELTRTAKAAYISMYNEAQQYADDRSNAKVALFNAVEKAIDSVIPANPCDPRRALVGAASMLYTIDLGSVYLYYLVIGVDDDEPESKIIVLHIETSKTHPDLSWLKNPTCRNEVVQLLDSFGIDGSAFLNNQPPFTVN
jgi:hypothetical protein